MWCFIQRNGRNLMRKYSHSAQAQEIMWPNWNLREQKAAFLQRVQQLSPIVFPLPDQRTQSARSQKPKNSTATYAVLVPLCTVNDMPCVLFTLRSSKLVKHRGEISFPGGKSDPTDKDPTETALRETEEEIGILRSRFDVWTSLPELPTREQQLLTAVVAVTDNISEDLLRVNSDEVEEVFACSIQHLCRPENHGITSFRISRKGSTTYTMPVFLAKDKFEQKRIWGMTATIMGIVLRCLVPESYPRLKSGGV